jgi:tetratricopeptide (TPR) repeat protein
MKGLLFIVFSFCASNLMFAQPDANLARQYADNGEYEKASVLYEKLSKQNTGNDYYFTQYLKCLNELGSYETSEEVIKKRLKQSPKEVWLYVEYGNVLEKQDKTAEAAKQFEKAVDVLPAEQGEIMKLANSFVNLNKFDFAARTYEKGNKLLKDDLMFSYELGEIYKQKGDVKKMIANYLNSLVTIPARMVNIQAYFQRNFSKEDYEELLTQLFERAQDQPESGIWPEMLAWVYVQKNDYKNAFRQLTAIDRRQNENGNRVYQLALSAQEDKQYDAAIEGYSYIIEKKGTVCPYYFQSKREILNCRRNKITEGYSYTREDLMLLAKEYDTFLTEFGRSKLTASIVTEEAKLYAFYLNDLPKAIEIMKNLVALPYSERSAEELKTKNQAKLDLGDYYLMSNEEWEATLLYSQVDKEMKDGVLGEMARFKNAKLSYYQGDFEWAQGQLDALKASTSELISNDAIDLSVFIMERYGLDTTAVPMEMFARAELLNYQNKYDSAFIVMDSINAQFPRHILLDAIFYVKADIFTKKRNYPEALRFYQKIIDEYKDGILVDNAVFKMAKLYENQLNDKAKAQEYYEKIITDYSSSIYVIEARKRFRILRGDKEN